MAVYNARHELPVLLGMSVGVVIADPAEEAQSIDYYINKSAGQDCFRTPAAALIATSPVS